MRSQAALLAAALALALAGCASRAKPLVTAQPAPLSTPQTQVVLPPAQPLDPAALATDTSSAESAPVPAEPTEPAAAPPAEPAVTPRVRRPAPAVAAPPAAPPAQPPAAPVETPVERPAIQAIVPAQEQKRLKESAETRKKEVRATLSRMTARRLSADDQDLVKRIQFFLAQSEEAERHGDMSEADVFAQRAQDLARGWQSGK
jgi:hypothetical protein